MHKYRLIDTFRKPKSIKNVYEMSVSDDSYTLIFEILCINSPIPGIYTQFFFFYAIFESQISIIVYDLIIFPESYTTSPEH